NGPMNASSINDANSSVASSHGVRTMYRKPSRTSASSPSTDVPESSPGSRRPGETGSVARQPAAASADSAAAVSAAPGEIEATRKPATAGPAAWASVGRTTPSRPFAASRSPAGRRPGTRAEYAG